MASSGRKGHHECEILSGKENEGGESFSKWTSCQKNPGHYKFIPARSFRESYLPKLQSRAQQEALAASLDLTVRLRVYCTSASRPDDDDLSEYRGSFKLRLGTGLIYDVNNPVINKTVIPDRGCGEEPEKCWSFYVKTAHHVVYNTEEARETRVDIFFEDENSDRDGTMKSVWGETLIRAEPDKDCCRILCTTDDETLVNKLQLAWFIWSTNKLIPPNVTDLNLLPPSDKGCFLSLIVSHPHGQAKKITVGKMTYRDKDTLVKYTTATCPGSSGAQVLVFDPNYNSSYPHSIMNRSFISVHSGSLHDVSTEQEDSTNYGYGVWIL